MLSFTAKNKHFTEIKPDKYFRSSSCRVKNHEIFIKQMLLGQFIRLGSCMYNYSKQKL